MRVQDYSEAVLGLVKSGMTPEHALDGLRTLLDSRGHSRLLPKILKDLLMLASKESSQTQAIVTLARTQESEKFKIKIEENLRALNVTEHTVRIDETLVGGFTIDAHEKRIDHSYKKRLLTLYRSLIKS